MRRPSSHFKRFENISNETLSKHLIMYCYFSRTQMENVYWFWLAYITFMSIIKMIMDSSSDVLCVSTSFRAPRLQGLWTRPPAPGLHPPESWNTPSSPCKLHTHTVSHTNTWQVLLLWSGLEKGYLSLTNVFAFKRWAHETSCHDSVLS